MARLHIAAALASATFAAFIILQLLSSFGFPRLDLLQLRYVAPPKHQASYQIPIHSPSKESSVPCDGTEYLLGVGKADITGYTLSVTPTKLC